MARAGWRHIHNIDYSQVVISHMARLHKSLPQLTYKVADVRWAQPARSTPPVATSCHKPPGQVLACPSTAMPCHEHPSAGPALGTQQHAWRYLACHVLMLAHRR